MIYAVRSADIQHGKLADAFEWAVRVAAYIREKFGTDTQVLRNGNGSFYRVHWMTSYDSLGDYEEMMAKIGEDEGYLALIDELREDYFFANVEDNFYATVP
jgi:hypothetical protein